MASGVSKETIARLESQADLYESSLIGAFLSEEDAAEALGVHQSTLAVAVNNSIPLQEAKQRAYDRVGQRIKKRTLRAALEDSEDARVIAKNATMLIWAGKNFAGLTDRAEVGQSLRVEYATAPRDESEGKASPFVPTVVRLPVDGGDKGEGSAGSEG